MGATYCNCIHVCCVYCIAEHSINRWCYTVNKSRFLEKSCLVKNYAPVHIILLNQLGFILYFSCNLKKKRYIPIIPPKVQSSDRIRRGQTVL